jgi:hypothetical protein
LGREDRGLRDDSGIHEADSEIGTRIAFLSACRLFCVPCSDSAFVIGSVGNCADWGYGRAPDPYDLTPLRHDRSLLGVQFGPVSSAAAAPRLTAPRC